ncbi:MAG TPA: chloride channel protein [Acidimicrobiales bacterium]|nr:chloride channel protein [Acidimicrobiales bacterium]
MATDPLALLRSRSYVALLVLAGILGVPISAAAWGFLELVTVLQSQIFTHLPHALGFSKEPVWWPIPLLAISGLLVALAIQYLPGTGGHKPAEGFKAGGIPVPVELPGVFFAALASLALGAVIGPEAPLIALGGGLGVLAVQLAKRDVPDQTKAAVAAAGSFAAISTLLGSPILAAFLLMEAAGLAGAVMDLVLLPGLVAAGTGSLMFVGLGTWTGLGTFSLVIPNLPRFVRPDAAEFGWAVAIGLAAALLGAGIRRLALFLQDRVEPRKLWLTPVIGLAVAGLAIAFEAGTGKGTSEVLFSGQSALGPLLAHSASYSLGAIVLLLACKGLAYSASLSSFRGGPIFPSLFVGAAGGIALSHAPGLPMVAGAAMGMGAMMVAMLRLPLTSVLIATLLLLSDGLAVTPLVIVAVAITYVAVTRLAPIPPAPATAPAAPADEAVPASRT